MAYNYVRVSVGGAMYGSDVWTINPIFMADRGLVPDDPTPTEMTAAIAAINTITPVSGLLITMAAATTFSTTRLEARGLQTGLRIVSEGARTPAVPGTGTSPHPAQSAVVCSLRTNRPGGSGRGRLYWPATGISLTGATGRVSTTTRAAFLAGMRTYLTAVEGALASTLAGEAFSLAVYSPTLGILTPVTSLQAGDVVDTQRRRRDDIPESYDVVPYPAP